MTPAESSPMPEEDRAGLLRLVRYSREFALAFVRSNRPADTRRIVEDLTTALSMDSIRVRELRLTETVSDLYGLLAELQPGLTADEAVVVTGFEESIPSGVAVPPALERLNIARERFRQLPCPVILVLPEYALSKLTRSAPDFWAWRSAVFETRMAPEPREAPVRKPLADFELDNLTRQQKERQLGVFKAMLKDPDRDEAGRSELHRRIAALHRGLGNMSEANRHAAEAWKLSPKESRERAFAARERASILTIQGELEEALQILREESLPIFRKLGDANEQSMALVRIADIYEVRGDLDEALRILQEESLPVSEKLGDARSRAITLGKIADIYQARGELDEALRIRQEEELPVYEKIGGVSERAITLRQTADIYQARGELGEALRIRQEEELPVFERLGDVRERAITLGKIADIYQERGELDEALRIRQEEELPVFEKLGDVRERAITLGRIADIYQEREELDAALRIRQEEELPVYEKLGDISSQEKLFGDIAMIRMQQGDLDEALRILQEDRMPIVERLGALDSKAHTLWLLSRIHAAKQDLESTLKCLTESYTINLQQGYLEAISFVGRDLGILLCRGGMIEEGRVILSRSRDGFEKLGHVDEARQVDTFLEGLTETAVDP